MVSKLFIYDPVAQSAADNKDAIEELQRIGGKQIAPTVWAISYQGSLIAHMRPYFAPRARLIEIPHDASAVVVQPGEQPLPDGLPYILFEALLSALAADMISNPPAPRSGAKVALKLVAKISPHEPEEKKKQDPSAGT